MIRSSEYQTLVASSGVAALCSSLFTNVLEVIKTRIMNAALTGMDSSPNLTHISKLRHTCRCYYCFIRDIFKKEGIRTVFRGFGYNASMSIIRSCLLFPLYEFSKPWSVAYHQV